MPTTTVGLYEVVLEQSYFTSNVLNVFHYLSNTSDDDVQLLCATAFDEDVMAALAVVGNISLKFDNIRCVNLTGTLADANITPSQADGDVVGAVVIDFVSSAFRYNRVTKDTRNGAKRFTGLVEENVTGGSFTVAYNVDLDALAVILGTDISTVGGVFSPVIVRKPVGAGGVWTFNDVVSVQNLDRVTTQNSRKTF